MIMMWLADYYEWHIIETRYFSLRGTSDRRSWHEAQADCKKGGGILASVHSFEEMDALAQFLRNRFVKL